jgi:beta-1,4-N-acetylglucosaminyltransferase
MSKRVFVTVGSTRFPELIKAVISPDCILSFKKLGYSHLHVQYGADETLFQELVTESMEISGFDYSPSIENEMKQADLIISHAGNYLLPS